MAIFVFSTKKPMGIAAYMDEGMRNVVLVGGLTSKKEVILLKNGDHPLSFKDLTFNTGPNR